MSILGRCPDCPSGTRDRILIGGKCPYHFQRGGVSVKEILEPEKPAKKKPIAKVSAKMKESLKVYSKLRKEYLKENPNCEAGLDGCTGKSGEIHHMKGRGKNLNEVSTWKAVCRSCHHWITENSEEAIKLGLSIKRNGKS